MHSKALIAAGAAFLFGTAGAGANGEPEYGAPPGAVERFDWSGPYVGVAGGWLPGEDEAFVLSELDEGPLSYETDGFAVGGVVGVNMQWGHVVYGGEVDAEYADLSGGPGIGGGGSLGKEINILGSLRGRLGFAYDRFLAYGTGGLAVGHVEMEAVEGPPPLFTVSGSDTAFGYTFGGGLEVGLWGNWAAGVEYRYTNLGDTQHEGDFSTVDDLTFTHTNRFHAVRARLVWRMPV